MADGNSHRIHLVPAVEAEAHLFHKTGHMAPVTQNEAERLVQDKRNTGSPVEVHLAEGVARDRMSNGTLVSSKVKG